MTTDPLGYSAEDHLELRTGSAGGLYTAGSVLERERARVFNQSWSLAATSEELAQPGAYVTTQCGDAPLVVVRDPAGPLRAFHNVCRHRGITLVEGSGTLGRFMTCPYHQWSYTLAGELARVPQGDDQFPRLERCPLGLHDAQVAEWQGMVFVNPSTDAPDLSSAMAGLDQRLDHFLSGPLRQVAVVQYEAACNWKLLVENHIDVYHLWYLHARSLAAYEHRSFAWESLGENWWSLEPLKDPTSVSGGFPWLNDDERHRIGAYLLFPNLMLVTTDHYFATYDASPISPGRTRLTLRVRATDGADAEGLVQSIRSFMAEDVGACERLQIGAASPRFGVGALAGTHEEPIRRFHRSLRQRMLA
ncbi:MAG TPA: aromatic ring-hydroxylating dioxygenase subunit alpha [Acidimicrobiales bacterium]|jgi:Rieske 2Fe-2S family protein|nr:aromatic ring-hydroxylating dioxygenase subunit alpha [Acidimicrobiales bacterium]